MHAHECPRTVAAVQVNVCVHVIIVVLMYTMHEGKRWLWILTNTILNCSIQYHILRVHECPRTVAAVQVTVCVHVVQNGEFFGGRVL